MAFHSHYYLQVLDRSCMVASDRLVSSVVACVRISPKDNQHSCQFISTDFCSKLRLSRILRTSVMQALTAYKIYTHELNPLMRETTQRILFHYD